jgi:hypothetical protein
VALGDGIRRNVAKISPEERNRLREAFRRIDALRFPDGVSYWDKQDQIHQATHVHGGPAFLPWHRELCNRLEAMLREVDPQLSLHYWDWTTDPRSTPDGNGGQMNLFTGNFMGSAEGRAGPPFASLDNGGVFAGSREDTGNPADPPASIDRELADGSPAASLGSEFHRDADLLGRGNDRPEAEQFAEFREALERMHGFIHGYIGGDIGFGHTAFEDPFVFLLHSNVDRLWAMWQKDPRFPWRLDPNRVYGAEASSIQITENMEPWAGGSGIRPWAPPEDEQEVKNSKHPTVVSPPRYDTMPIPVRKGDSGSAAGSVQDIAVARIADRRILTAVRTGEGTLKLISWNVSDSGSVSRRGDSGDQAGSARSIDIARGQRLVTACRDGDGDLKLISWNVPDSGAISRAGDSGNQAGTASLVRIVALPPDLFLTACRDGDGDLKLISWRLNSNGGISRLGDSGSAAGEVSEISLLALPGAGGARVITAVRTNEGTLKLIVWTVSPAGVITRRSDSGAQAGTASLIRSALDSHGHIVTAVRTGEGRLRLITWALSEAASSITRLGDSGNRAGRIFDNALMARPNGRLISALRTEGGRLKLIVWSVTAGGAVFRDGDSAEQAGTASIIRLCPEPLSGNAPLVTAVRTASNDLKLITWSDL